METEEALKDEQSDSESVKVDSENSKSQESIPEQAEATSNNSAAEPEVEVKEEDNEDIEKFLG
jgi:hypothetical protein